MRNEKIFDDADEFWSLDDLLPQKEKTAHRHVKNDTEAVELEIDGEERETGGEKIPKRQYPPITQTHSEKNFDEWLSERRKQEKERFTYGKVTLNEYVPDNSLIKKVTVSADPSLRRIRERFLLDAIRMYDLKCEFKGNVPFTSYYPQYSQMNAAQTECYIGFRTDIRKGIYNKVDTAYIYLYLYELINTPSKASPESRAGSICELIKAYHDLDESLFANMCNWLCDMCLIHNVKLKSDVFGALTPKIASACRIKEFFLGSDALISKDYALISAVTSYDYKKSRFYADNRTAYDSTVPKAVSAAIAEMSKNDGKFLKENESACTLIHESYTGALCSGTVKCTISLECVCITRSENVKRAVSEAVKYAENCLRSQLGIKPRLTVNYLSSEYKSVIKRYFTEHQAFRRDAKKTPVTINTRENIPEYEALYEPKSHGVSFEEARKIEESSWEITKQLVTETDEEAETSHSSSVDTVSTSKSESGRRAEILGLMYLMKKDIGSFNSLAVSQGLLPDAFADKVNEYALEKIGDIALIRTENGYDIIEDYITEIKDILSENGSL